MPYNSPLKISLFLFGIAAGLTLLTNQAMAQARTLNPTTQAPTTPSAASASQAPEFAADIDAEKILFAVSVSSRVPMGVSDVFDSDVHSVYCWNQLHINHVPVNIRHDWYWNNQKISESTFRVHFNNSRVWSKRAVHPGEWRVEIRDADSGRLIAVGAFVVRKH